MGLSVDEFYDLTYEEFGCICDGYSNRLKRDLRLNWETARFIAYHSIIPHSKKKLKITDLITFSWEDDDKIERIKEAKKVNYDILPKVLKG